MGDDGIVLYAVEKKKAVRVISLPWEAQKFEEKLVSALKSGYTGSVIILYDAVEQHYRKDRIPPVGLADKKKVINRKLNLAFPNLTIKAAMELKGAKQKGIALKKSTEKPEFIFAGLPKSEMLTRLVEVLYEAEVSIKGLALLPVESVGLVDELTQRCVELKGAERSKWSIMIGQNETGGLHQIVVKDGNLAMRRITPVPDNISPAAFSGEISREFKATLSYIARLGYHERDGLDVVVVAPKDSHSALNASKLPVANLCLLDLPEALEVLGGQYAGEATRTYSDSIYALWAANKSKLTMPMKMPELERVSMPRKAAQAGIGALFLAALGLVYMNYNSFSVYNDRLNLIEYKTTQQNALAREYEQESAVFNELPMPPETVEGVIGVKKMLQENTIELSPQLQALNEVFGDIFLLQSFDFMHEPDEDASISSTAGEQNNFAAAVQQVIPGQEQVTNNRGTMTLEFTVALTQLGVPLEERVSRAEGLLERLKASFPNHEVEIVRQFGGISRTGALVVQTEADDGVTAMGDVTADFRIEGPPL